MNIRKATLKDIDGVEAVYDEIHTAEENGSAVIGWVRGIYPIRDTAEQALLRDDLFVMEENGVIVGAAVINKQQVKEYENGSWLYDAPDDKVTVLHTLVITPSAAGQGFGKAFIDFYEAYAAKTGAPYLRIDTNERNARAREMYKKLGYREAGITPCSFNGIDGVRLVMLEKKV